jgi:OOP family OmpA-OmpF porin
VDVLVPKVMESKILTLSSTEIGEQITSAGRVALYGIFFDFDKADLKSESDAETAQMAAYIKAHASARVFITGRTDNQGSLDLNLALSQRRAEAVLKVLRQRYGVDASQVAAKGLALLAPLASNATEEGRAKNRRVELVGG